MKWADVDSPERSFVRKTWAAQPLEDELIYARIASEVGLDADTIEAAVDSVYVTETQDADE